MGCCCAKKVKPLTDDEIENLKENTCFNKDQITMLHTNFCKDYPTGYVSLPEFISVYSEFYPTGDVEEFASRVFKAFDTDKNGYLDFMEFCQGFSITSQGTIEDKLRWAFSIYDEDQSGQIDKKELLAVFTAIAKMLEMDEKEAIANCERIFVAIDADESGEISIDEFMQAVMSDKSAAAWQPFDLFGEDAEKGVETSDSETDA